VERDMVVETQVSLLAMDELYVMANQIEAGLWIAIGIAFAIRAICRQENRREYGLLAPVFVVFGISDLVEVHYGQWWDPWWLFVWKGVCVLVFLYALVRYIAVQRQTKRHAATEGAQKGPQD
jgi:hypothetical protein